MNPKKNIVMVTPAFHPSVGGVEQHVLQLCKELQKKGHHVSVVTCTTTSNLPTKEKYQGIHIFRSHVSDVQNKRAVWQGLFKLRKIFLTSEVVHVHDVFWWILPLYFDVRKKVFLTFHGWEGQFPVAWSAKLHRKIASLLSLGRAHVGQFISQFYWDRPDLIIYGAPQKVANKTETIHQPLHLVFVGRLVKENEIVLYLQYLKELREHQPITVTWVGDGHYHQQCQQFGTVTGLVKNVLPFIEKADIVLANSYLSLFEAHGQGKPTVSLYSHPLKQAYLETFPLADEMIIAAQPEEAVLETLHLIRNKQTYRQRSQRILDKVQDFSWSKIADQYLNLWK